MAESSDALKRIESLERNPVDKLGNARALLWFWSEVVAYAKEDGKTGHSKIGLRNLILTDEGHRLLLDENAAERKRLEYSLLRALGMTR